MKPATVRARIDFLLEETRSHGFKEGLREGLAQGKNPERHAFVTFVDGDGSSAMYLDGKLVMSGEHLDPVVVVRHLIHRTPTRVEYVDADLQALDEGGFPKLLQELVRARP